MLGGIPRHNGSGLPFEVLHTPARIAFTYNYNTSRRISIGDELKPDPNAVPTYFGTLDRALGGRHARHRNQRACATACTTRSGSTRTATPTSDQTRVVERWTRPDFHHFQLEMTVTDPKYYTRPFKFIRTWARAPKGLGQQEYACNEMNLDAEHIGPGAGVIGPDGNRGYGYTEPLPAVPPGPEAYGHD